MRRRAWRRRTCAERVDDISGQSPRASKNIVSSAARFPSASPIDAFPTFSKTCESFKLHLLNRRCYYIVCVIRTHASSYGRANMRTQCRIQERSLDRSESGTSSSEARPASRAAPLLHSLLAVGLFIVDRPDDERCGAGTSRHGPGLHDRPHFTIPRGRRRHRCARVRRPDSLHLHLRWRRSDMPSTAARRKCSRRYRHAATALDGLPPDLFDPSRRIVESRECH